MSLQGAAGTSMWAAAIFLVGVSSTLTGINFVVTIFKMRAPGHDLHAHAAVRAGGSSRPRRC